jgi:hypothetical protein
MDLMNISSFTIGIVSLILTVYYGYQGRNVVQMLMSNFDQKFMDVLTAMLEGGNLSRADQVRGISKNVSVEYDINMPSDEYIVRVLRRLALRYEQSGKNAKKELTILERIRKEIEPRGLPLMSIASINRLTAFQIIMISAIISLIVLQFFFASGSDSRLPGVVIIILQVLIVIVTYNVKIRSAKLLKKDQR